MRIEPAKEIGAYRPLCVHKVRVAAKLATLSARRGAWQRKQIGVPVDQCGKRSDFLIDGKPICRAHAGAMALAFLLSKDQK